MNRSAFLALVMAAVAIFLSVFCFLQLVVRKTSTEQALGVVVSYVKREQLRPEDLNRLDKSLNTIRWNDQTVLQARFNLWLTGVLGFPLLAVMCLVLAYRIDQTIFGGEGKRAGAS